LGQLLIKPRERTFTKHDVRKFMEDQGLNITTLADLFGVTEQAVKYWLDGQRSVPEPTSRLFLLFQLYPGLKTHFKG
jgi:DNA-binding transcriptional regulator YiaG